MTHYRTLFSLSLAAFCLSSCIPPQFVSQSGSTVEQQEIALTDVRCDVDFVKNEQDNVNVGLRLLEGKIATLEGLHASLRRELMEAQQEERQLVLNKLTAFQERTDRFSSTQEGLVADIRQLKTHSNDVGSSLTQSKRKIKEFEGAVDEHGEHLRSLEGALRALMALVQEGGESTASRTSGASGYTYKVKSGDTLEKIARAHHTTVTSLKRTNGLKNDLIVIGQELRLPRE